MKKTLNKNKTYLRIIFRAFKKCLPFIIELKMLQKASLVLKLLEDLDHILSFIPGYFLCIPGVSDRLKAIIRQFDVLKELVRNVLDDQPFNLEKAFPDVVHSPILENNVLVHLAHHAADADEPAAAVH